MAEPAEEGQFELDVGDAEATEIELEQPEEENVPRGTSESEPEVEVVEETSKEDSEIEQYSESVQKRINRLTKKMRDAERREEEAIRYAQNVQSEAEKIRQRMETLDQGFMNEYGQRISIQQQQAEANLRRAVELGDAESNRDPERRYNQPHYCRRFVMPERNAKLNLAPSNRHNRPHNRPHSQALQEPQRQRPDPKAEVWAEKNSWFGNDEAMTFAAFKSAEVIEKTRV